jgi:hypothetical protein
VNAQICLFWAGCERVDLASTGVHIGGLALIPAVASSAWARGGPGPAYGTGRLSGRMDAVADDILELHRAFDHAELRGDPERLGALLDDDFLSIGEQGYQLGKQEWIGRHGEFRYLSIETTEVDVRRYDKTAIVRCVQRSRATWRGEPMALAVRLSQVWIWRPGGWQLAAIQFSTLGSG